MGKTGIIIIILGAIILIALVPWFFIVTGNFDWDIGFDFSSSNSEQSIPEIVLPTSPPPPPSPSPTPKVEPEPTPDPQLEETIIAIATEFPELFEELK